MGACRVGVKKEKFECDPSGQAPVNCQGVGFLESAPGTL